MASPAILKIDIISALDAKGFGKTETGLDKLGRTAGRVGGIMAGGLAAGFVGATKAAEDQSTANEQVRSTLEATGNGAADTVAAVQKMSDEYAKLTGVSANVVKQSAAILGSFKEVSSSAGEAGGIMDRALVLTLDLAAAGMGEVSSNAKSLGRALQDPIKGMASLGEQGVTFTAQQEEQIRALTETGNLLEAQTLLLDAVAANVGGAAENTANSTDKMRESIRSAAAAIGENLLPMLETMAAALATASEWIAENTDLVLALGAGMAVLAAVALTVSAVTKVVAGVQAVAAGATWLYNAAVKSGTIFNIAMTAAALGLAAAQAVAAGASKLFTGALGLLKGALTLITKHPIIAVVTLLAALILSNEEAVAALMAVLEPLLGIFGTLADLASSILVPALDAVRAVVEGVAGAIQWLINLIGSAISAIGDLVSRLNPFSGMGRSATIATVGAAGFGVTAAARRETRAAPAINITVNGAIDPHTTAKTVARTLRAATARTGYPLRLA